jgi:hypothetical protein
MVWSPGSFLKSVEVAACRYILRGQVLLQGWMHALVLPASADRIEKNIYRTSLPYRKYALYIYT